MKVLTKKWLRDYELNAIVGALSPFTDEKMPFVFTNGGTNIIAKKDLHTVKTNFNLSDKENEINFCMIPNTFAYYGDYFKNANEPEYRSIEADFLSQYVNRLRVISFLPEDILKLIKDKRMLALGYAEEKVKKMILDYVGNKVSNAVEIFENSISATIENSQELTATEQIEINRYYSDITELFEENTILKTEIDGSDLRLITELDKVIVLCGAKELEMEDEIKNSYIKAYEIYKSGKDYELHLLLKNVDENLVDNFFYVTYQFNDLKFA